MDNFNSLPIILFAISMSITPGPNNIMLTSSGANFGYRKTLPHILGIIAGIAVLNILSALGLKQLFLKFPSTKLVLKVIGVLYMVYLAFKISISKTSFKNKNSSKKPLSIFEAALFQLLNPKAVLMTITAMSLYTIEGTYFKASSITVIIIFAIIGFTSISCWALLGKAIGFKLKGSKFVTIFNYAMGLLTLICALLLLF